MNNGNDVLENIDVDLFRDLSNRRWKKNTEKKPNEEANNQKTEYSFVSILQVPVSVLRHQRRI